MTDNGQKNFGKAVLAIASVKAKEMHDDFIFNFGMHHICFYPNPPMCTFIRKLKKLDKRIKKQ